MERRALIHIGTHKTGTKSIQALFLDNFHLLRASGLYVPQVGRLVTSEGMGTPGQHGLVLALRTRDKELLAQFRDEVRAEDARCIYISSEEFHPMVAVPGDLRYLRELIESLGYTSTIVLYLRPQDEYAQSVYAELAKGGHSASRRFASFAGGILEHDALYHDSNAPTIFAYSKILQTFAEIFGEANVVVRRYYGSDDPYALLRDFARVTNSVLGINIDQLAIVDPYLNRRGTFGNVMADLYAMAKKSDPAALSPDALVRKLGIAKADPRLRMPFGVLSQNEAQAFATHFAADNALVEAMSGVKLEIETANRDWETAAFQRAFLDFAGDVWFK